MYFESSRPYKLYFKLLSNLYKTMNGVIKKKTDKGFGFITVEGQEKDLFFHSKSLVDVTFDELKEGDSVTFEIEESPKGPNATNVKRV